MTQNQINNNFTKEKPVDNFDEDQKGLNRSNFAKHLSLNIENYLKLNNDSLTIGLMGEWGSGKTSIINLTKRHINEEEIKIFEFNPWVYSSYNQLISQFFEELISQFSDEPLIKELKKYWLKINKYDLIKSASVSVISIFNNEIGEFLKENIEMDSEEKSLKKIKDNINKELENHKILCIMDDFDRISSEEIKEMFRLIKIIADFDNMIYIISFDKEIVKNALKDNYGEKFIEKIINVPLDVPLATHDELSRLLKEELIEISKIHGLELDEARLNSFLEFSNYKNPKNFGITYFFKNVRDIKRLMNILRFNIELIKDEINFIDFTVITSIQLFYPKIYEEIKYNESLLIEYKIPKMEYSSNPDFVEEEKIKFESIVGKNENIKFILQRLFPKMNFIYKTNHISLNDNVSYDVNLLICSENHFKTYFKLNPIIKNMTEEEINQIIDLINSRDEYKVINKIKNLFENDKFYLLFERLHPRINRINEPQFFLELIFSLDNEISINFFDSNSINIEKTCFGLIILIENKNRFNILKNEFENSNNIIFIYNLLRFIEVNKNGPYEEETILNEKEIDDLKTIIKIKYSDYLKKYSEKPNEFFRRYLEIGTYFKLKSDNDEFIEKLISNKEGLLMFLNSIISVNGNHFIKNEIENIIFYTTMEAVKKEIDKYDDDLEEELVVKRFLEDYKLYKENIKEFN